MLVVLPVVLGLTVGMAAADVILPIPGRQQWNIRHGYCGSCSLQQSALYFGNWVSQDLVRKSVGDTEVLPGVNEATAARRLQFSVRSWNGGDRESSEQYEQFMLWVKRHLLRSHPVVVTVYLSDWSDSDFDHIMPAIGVRTVHNDSAYHGDDTLVINNNFKRQHIERTFDSFKGTRKSCSHNWLTGGCIPEKVDYGVAIQGVVDPNGETLPLRLSVDRWDEPNVVDGEKPADLTGTLRASGLTVGARYLLLRYGEAKDVPESGFASASSRKAAEKVMTFTAKGATWTYTDPTAIKSSGAAFYRLVRAAGDIAMVV